MPNWKSYESSVRLLSAILAAHPELKLNYQEIADCFGDNATGSSIQFRFRRVKADAEAIRAARAKGIDPQTLDMDGGMCKEISRRYGGDCTVSALENRFRRIKGDAKALNDALARGIDPITISTDSLNGKSGGKEIAKYYGDCTAYSLDHRLRPIKKEALAMREAIADKYGEDTTAKAVSTRFERLKKEPSWLTNSNSGFNGMGTPNGNSKPKTPRKQKKLGVAGGSGSEDDDETFEEKKPTPKKSNLNKTQGGRVSKPQTPRKNGATPINANMAPISVPSDDDDHAIKKETLKNSSSFALSADDIDDDGAQFYQAGGYASSEGDMA